MGEQTSMQAKRLNDATPQLSVHDGIMIAWKKECYRSSATARVFDIPTVFIWPEVSGAGPLVTAKRYWKSAKETVRVIKAHNPRTVVLLNQPPFIVLAALLARRSKPFELILDFHSGALSKPMWKPFAPMYRRVVRSAPFVIAHNRFDGESLADWGAKPVHFIALPRPFGPELRDAVPDDARILVVCSFADDEPIATLFEAMRRCPEIRFEVTGKHEKARDAIGIVPPNVTLLGFVDYDVYLQRFATATAAATFSTRPHIMQMAVHEAISLGVPVVTNESETLREVLEDGGVYCEIAADAIAEAFRSAVRRRVELRENARALLSRRNQALKSELDIVIERARNLLLGSA